MTHSTGGRHRATPDAVRAVQARSGARPTTRKSSTIKPSAPGIVDQLTIRVTRSGRTYDGSVATSRFDYLGSGANAHVALQTTEYNRFQVTLDARPTRFDLVDLLAEIAAEAYARGLGNPVTLTLLADFNMDPLPGL